MRLPEFLENVWPLKRQRGLRHVDSFVIHRKSFDARADSSIYSVHRLSQDGCSGSLRRDSLELHRR